MKPCATRRTGTDPAPVLRSYAELELLRLHDRRQGRRPKGARNAAGCCRKTAHDAADNGQHADAQLPSTHHPKFAFKPTVLRASQVAKDRWEAAMYLQVRIGKIFNFSPHPIETVFPVFDALKSLNGWHDFSNIVM